MRIWVALLIAPMLALADQAVAYATVGWSCTHGEVLAVHAVHALCLAAAAASVFPAWRLWTTTRSATGEVGPSQRHFLAGLAVASGALSTLVIAAMWMPTWVIAPCID